MPPNDTTAALLMDLRSGKVWGALVIRAADEIERLQAEVERLKEYDSPTTRRWRHKKRGSVYEEIGRAEVQIASLGTRICEEDVLVVYRDADGKLWARHEDEFEDGRFEEINDA